MKFKNIIVTIVISLLVGVGCFFVGRLTIQKSKCEENKEDKKIEEKEKSENDNNNKNNDKDLINHTFTRTYNINHIAYSNDYNYLYITIREFQGEEIETVKVLREKFENANTGDNYEITFKINNNGIEDNLKSIFANSEVIKANKTDKTGLEQIYENIE